MRRHMVWFLGVYLYRLNLALEKIMSAEIDPKAERPFQRLCITVLDHIFQKQA